MTDYELLRSKTNHERCMKCTNCLNWDKQRASYAAAMSENRDTLLEVELRAEWNSIKHEKEFECIGA